jgi:hypothetical protein
VAGHSGPVATFGGPADIPLEAPYLYRLAGLSLAGIPGTSLYAFNFGASAAALSAGSSTTVTAAVATSPPSSTTSSGTTVTAQTPVKHHKHKQEPASITAAALPAQASSASLHDVALAALQGTLGHRQKRGFSSLPT